MANVLGTVAPAVVRPRRVGDPRRRERATGLLLAGGVALVSLPYALRGPGFFREDWESLRNARILGSWHAAADTVSSARPLDRPVFALVFGGLGEHPLAVYAVLTALNALVAVLLYRLARRFLATAAAVAVAGVWVMLPTHSSLSRWASTAHITVALAVLLAGALALVGAVRLGRSALWPAVAFAASALLYEAVLIPAVVMVGVAASRARGRRLAIAGPAVLLLVPTVAWAVTRTTKPAPELIRLTDVISSNVGWGINDAEPWWRVLQLLALVGVVVAGARVAFPGFRDKTGCPEWTALAGAVVIAVGAVPFVGFAQDIDFVAQGDRANMVSAIGAALLIVGVASMLPRRAYVIALLGVAALCVPTRLQQDADWARTADEVDQVLAHLDAQLPARPEPVRLGVHPIAHAGVEGLENSWDASMALQATRADPRWHVVFVYEPDQLGPGGFDIDAILGSP